MKSIRSLCSFLAACALAAAALAADATGTWKWKVTTPNGDIETTLKLALKDGALAGTYSNSFGESVVSNVSVKDGDVGFDVERDLGGNKFTLKYRGRLDGDSIKGTIEAPGFDGGAPTKLEWNAKRVKEMPAPAPKQ